MVDWFIIKQYLQGQAITHTTFTLPRKISCTTQFLCFNMRYTNSTLNSGFCQLFFPIFDGVYIKLEIRFHVFWNKFQPLTINIIRPQKKTFIFLAHWSQAAIRCVEISLICMCGKACVMGCNTHTRAQNLSKPSPPQPLSQAHHFKFIRSVARCLCFKILSRDWGFEWEEKI